jgi:geranylgeranyl reductase family protein
MRQAWDVAVIGAGPAGSAAAHYLAQRGLAVTLLDRCAFPRDKTCGDGLTPRAVAALHAIGVLPELLRAGQPIAGVDIFAPDGYPTAASIPCSSAAPVPMLVVPRLALDDAVRRRAVASGARFQGSLLVDALEPAGDGVVVKGRGPDGPVAIAARAAVVATGAAAALVASLGLAPEAPRLMLAARAYYHGIAGGTSRIQIRFDHAPLPGYGWVFPTSADSANVGVGYFPAACPPRKRPPARRALERFAASPPLARLMHGARRDGPIRGYPLRTHFPEAPTSRDRILLAGEAAGLVNPLTGEGIDYALESGQIAADALARAFAAAALLSGPLHDYDRALRARFERLFLFCRRVRDASLRPAVLNRLVRVASRRDDLQRLLVDLVLGNREIAERLTVGRMVRTAFALIR